MDKSQYHSLGATASYSFRVSNSIIKIALSMPLRYLSLGTFSTAFWKLLLALPDSNLAKFSTQVSCVGNK